MKKINVKGAVLRVAATGGGAIAAASLDKVPAIAKLKLPIRGAIKMAIGAFAPGFLGKGKKSELFENVGAGMIAVGALQVYNGVVAKTDVKKQLTVISGVDTLGSVRVYVPSSVNSVDTLGSTL